MCKTHSNSYNDRREVENGTGLINVASVIKERKKENDFIRVSKELE